MNEWQEAEQHVERAHELYELGHWDEAESALRRALTLNPYQAEWHFNLGLTLAAAGRPEAALDALTEAHRLGDGIESQSCLEIAGVLLDLDRPEDAIGWLREAIERNPSSLDAHVQLIDVYALLDRHDDAELHFYLALQLDASSATAYATMAESLIDRRQLDRAMWCLQEASRIDGTLPRIAARMAYVCSLTGRLERARQLYTREIRENPGDADTIVDFGRLLVDMHRPREASEKFHRALELVPDHLDAHFSLGELADEDGDADLARRHYLVVEKLDPTYNGVRRRLARVLMLQAERTNDQHATRAARVLALQDLADAKRDEYEYDALRDLAELLLDLRLGNEARAAGDLLVAARPGDASSHHLLAVAHFGAGDSAAGIEASRRALRLRPDHIPAVHNLAVAYLRRGELVRARYWVRKGLALDSDDRGLRRLRAYLRVHALRSIAGWVAMLLRPSR
ncbi:MAG: tetratricopeptide repeat protein [Planctomycetota bacterium]